MDEKKVYVPTLEELYIMQDMGANIYKYLLIKAIEAIAMDGVKYPEKGMLKSVYKCLLEDNPDIEYAICRMYPSELRYSKLASSEPFMCEFLLDKEEDRTIYNLDNLVNFNDLCLNYNGIKDKVISILSSKLPITPQYRFEYKDFEYVGKTDKGFPILKYNKLLNNIFACECQLSKYEVASNLEKLITIEPVYAIKYKDILKTDSVGLLRQGINGYGLRYGIGYDVGMEYKDKDILTNPSTEVKRLVRCINNGEKKIRL